jgi:uncharacterized Zn finger protein (UPF0148 family)
MSTDAYTGLARCSSCGQPFFAIYAGILGGRCSPCAGRHQREEKRAARTAEQRATELKSVVDRVDPRKADKDGYQPVHFEDIEELLAEIERSCAIEAAARAAYDAEKAWRENGGMNAELASAMCNARVTLRGLLEKGGAK